MSDIDITVPENSLLHTKRKFFKDNCQSLTVVLGWMFHVKIVTFLYLQFSLSLLSLILWPMRVRRQVAWKFAQFTKYQFLIGHIPEISWHLFFFFFSIDLNVFFSLFQAENIYNDEDPDTPASELESGASWKFLRK